MMRTDLQAAGFEPDEYLSIGSVINHKNRRCPECGSTFINWNPNQRRWCCLVRICGWIEENESQPEDDTHYYKYITGNWYEKEKGRRRKKKVKRAKRAAWLNG